MPRSAVEAGVVDEVVALAVFKLPIFRAKDI